MWLCIDSDQARRIADRFIDSQDSDLRVLAADITFYCEEQTSEDAVSIRLRAKRLHEDGRIEVSDDAAVSFAMNTKTSAVNGAYVHAWLWVEAETMKRT